MIKGKKFILVVTSPIRLADFFLPITAGAIRKIRAHRRALLNFTGMIPAFFDFPGYSSLWSESENLLIFTLTPLLPPDRLNPFQSHELGQNESI